MLPHPLHLLLPLLHIVLRVVRVVGLVELLPEEDPDFVLVPLSVPVQVVHSEERLRVPVLRTPAQFDVAEDYLQQLDMLF